MDLSTKYLGLTLKNPLVVSASPLSEDIDNIRKMEEAGASAVVLHSLFEEQITVESFELDRHLSDGAESSAESLSYFPNLTSYNMGPEGYLAQVAKAKTAVKIPIIASLNGVSSGGWIRTRRRWKRPAPTLSSSTSTPSRPTSIPPASRSSRLTRNWWAT